MDIVWSTCPVSAFICALNIGVLLSILSNIHIKVQFTIRDIKRPQQLIEKILTSDDKVSEFIRKSASISNIKLIEKHRNANFLAKTSLVPLLNNILENQTVYDSDRFSSIEIDRDTQKLIDEKPVEDELILLNRKLLEFAYPEELGIFKIKEHKKSAKENIGLMSKLMKNDDFAVNITAGNGFYVNVKKASKINLDETLNIPETMRVEEISP